MNATTRRHRSLILAAAVTITLALAGGVAWASIPDPNGVIHACYDTKGALRVVDTTTTCKNGETSLDWSQQGPRGATGSQGPPGLSAPGRSVLMENVADDGTLLGGDATAIDHPRPGTYIVHFGRSVIACAATATIGNTFTSGGFTHTTATPNAEVAADAPDTVTVFMQATDTTSDFESAFHLIVAC